MQPVRPQSALRYPLAGILGTQTNVRVLRVLALHGGALSASRLTQDAGMSGYGVRLALDGLDGCGIVRRLGQGRSILYQLDERHPLAAILADLFRAEADRVAAIFDAIRRAVADPAIAAAWIYGSFSRGEDTFDSDQDIVLVGETLWSNDPVAERARERLDEASERLLFRPLVVHLAFDDVLRLSSGDPWWESMRRDAHTIKGEPPADLARQILKKRRPAADPSGAE